jgi:cytochrome c556
MQSASSRRLRAPTKAPIGAVVGIMHASTHLIRCAALARLTADVAKPVDAADLKSAFRKELRVRIPPSAPTQTNCAARPAEWLRPRRPSRKLSPRGWIMSRRLIMLIMSSGAWIALAASALAQQAPAGVPGPDAIAARKASLDMSSITFRSMGEAIKAGHDAQSLSYPAAALAKWAKALPGMFPTGTGEDQTSEHTQARAQIWQDHAGFERAAAKYADATTQLAALAGANDTQGFTRQLVVVDQACHSCHSRYKDGPQ